MDFYNHRLAAANYSIIKNPPHKAQKIKSESVPPARFERTTPGLGIWFSILMTYGGNQVNAVNYFKAVKVYSLSTSKNLFVFIHWFFHS